MRHLRRQLRVAWMRWILGPEGFAKYQAGYEVGYALGLEAGSIERTVEDTRIPNDVSELAGGEL